MSVKKILSIIISVVILFGAGIFLVLNIKGGTKADEISLSQAEEFVNKAFDDMAVTNTLKKIAENNHIKVNKITYGNEKDIILSCDVESVDVYSIIEPEVNGFFNTEVKKSNGMYKSASDFAKEFEEKTLNILNGAQEYEKSCEIYLYDTKEGLKVYASDEVTDCVYGGVVSLENKINETTSFVDIKTGNDVLFDNQNGNLKKGFIQTVNLRRDLQKPDTSTFLIRTWNGLKADFIKNFVEYDRWKTILQGLWVTIKLTICALLIGIVIGFIVAFIRCTYLKNTKHGILIRILNGISQVYLTVIRGTPVVVQIMIIYFVIFMPMGVDKFLSAVVCFGLNSGAYVAEIVRGGIMSVDNGQTEAGRSLGFSYIMTMWYIVFPQAFKAVLPALANEFVVLLKETSIAFYIGLGDLMYAGNAIRAATYSAFMPLVAVAIIYFIMVLVLSKLVSLLERRLRNNER